MNKKSLVLLSLLCVVGCGPGYVSYNTEIKDGYVVNCRKSAYCFEGAWARCANGFVVISRQPGELVAKCNPEPIQPIKVEEESDDEEPKPPILVGPSQQ